MPHLHTDQKPQPARTGSKKALPTRPPRGKRAANPPKRARVPLPKRVHSAVETLAGYYSQGHTPTRARDGRWKPLFLAALEFVPIVAVACRVAGISRKAAYLARRTDRDFSEEWDEAVEAGLDAVEAAAFKSAVFGDERPVYQQGVCVGTVIEYSDAMRALLLKGRRREVFGDRMQVERPRMVPLTLEEFEQRMKEAEA